MNERLKELMLEAGYAAPEIASSANKLAELIVRECLTVINQPNGVGDDDVIRISRDVKKHFGVES
jgi:hypothetical protein